MNTIPPPANPARRAILVARLVAVLLISIGAGTYVWLRPLPPTWESSSSENYFRVIGVTKEGRVVSLAYPQNKMLPAHVCVHDAETGRVIVDHLLFSGRYDHQNCKLTGDDQWVLLEGGDAEDQEMSLQDGTLRDPTWKPREGDVCTADGRYAVKQKADGDQEEEYADYIVDLTTGEWKWKCGDTTRFSPDSQRYLTTHWDEDRDQHLISIHSLVDNRELLSEIIPDSPEYGSGSVEKWTGDRLYFTCSYGISPHGIALPTGTRSWSYDTRGPRLSDPQFDPTTHVQWTDDGLFSQVVDEHGGECRQNPTSPFLMRIHDTLDRWNIETGIDDNELSYQQYSTTTMRPVGGRIHGLHHKVSISPGGRWLADGGHALRVWRLPATRGWTRSFQTILAAALPWGLLRIRRRGKTQLLSNANAPETLPVVDDSEQRTPP